MEGFQLKEPRDMGGHLGYFEVAIDDFWNRMMPFEKQDPVFAAIEAADGVHHSDAATGCNGFGVWTHNDANMDAVRLGVVLNLTELEI